MSSPQTITVSAPPAPRRRGGFVGDFFTGVSFLIRGIGMYVRSPGTMLLGLLPAVITFALLVAGGVAMVMWSDDLARLITPFANTWDSGLRDTARGLVALAMVVAYLLLGILLFAALTLTIGEPFYEAISKRVDDRLGGVPGGDIDVSFWRTLPRSLWENLRLLTRTILVVVVVFAVGLIPVAGQIAGPVLGGLFGGWALAVELTSVPFERRGLHLRHRRQWLKTRPFMTLGFGVAAFVCFLIPFGAIIMMPAAVAGSTLLSRRLFDQST